MRDILEQVRRVRSNKIHAGLQLLVAPITVKLNNLSAMEINTIRPFFQGSLDRFYSLSQVRKLTQWPLHRAAYTLNAHTGGLLRRWRTTFTARSRRTRHSRRAKVS